MSAVNIAAACWFLGLLLGVLVGNFDRLLDWLQGEIPAPIPYELPRSIVQRYPEDVDYETLARELPEDRP